VEFDELDAMLRETFEDRILSRAERLAIGAVFEDLAMDENRLRYVRNRAFEMAREALEQGLDERILEWLQDVVRAIDTARTQGTPEASVAYFSPGGEPRGQIITLAHRSRATIDACVFTITDERIVRALVDAHGRGVAVRIITDDEKAHDRGSHVMSLWKTGIPVVTDASPDHMHNKFALFDRRVLLNGSFNWTRAATERNVENVVVTRHAELVESFARKFDELWGAYSPFQA